MRTVRRKDREIGAHEAIELLSNGEYGVLSTIGKDGQPYGVPLSYAYKDNCLYFHCALDGHKLENIANNPKVSFCVVGDTKVLPEEFATEYESAVVFGTASEVQGAERNNALVWLLGKYSPAFIEEGKLYIDQKDKATRVMKIVIDQISGKARRPA
jgi:nitroimidazol reductase NimA-like FMN-containing flavoprotein (pyridoxamine 5'-phosphate oxidase superfamily)